MKLGVIGAGNMGGAIIRGCVAAGMDPQDITVKGHHPKKMEAMKNELRIKISNSAGDLAADSDAVMIAVKPKDSDKVLTEITPFLKSDTIIVSIVAGKSINDINKVCNAAAGSGKIRKIVRVMPNTPSMIGEGMSALCRSEAVSDEEYKSVEAIFAGIGRVSEVAEPMMDAVTGLSGSGPAYVYMFIEALADGAVLSGMPRSQAYEFAAQTVAGAAKMVLETGRHPGELKDDVCSPAGTTIEAVRTLEKGGFRSMVMEAVIASAEKSKNL